MIKRFLILIATIHLQAQLSAQKPHEILPGAYQTKEYLPLLKGKRVAVFANHTSFINKTHLVDSLIKLKVNVIKIFAPEHGFRGNASAGEKLQNDIDSLTKIPIVSLYGNKLKPSENDLANADVMLFDIQDVGVRFYTYISSLQYFMEAAISNNKPLIILDRPNPNGFYVDGPVLQPEYKSFVGMQPVPIVYGMTIGEYAKMLLGEKWLDWKYVRESDKQISLAEMLGFTETKKNFSLTVIKCKNYSHKSLYQLPIHPSPNLNSMASIYWYPSTCLFEGTVISEGRGTEHPFCIFGHPSFSNSLFSFTPTAKPFAKNPKHCNRLCYGFNVYKEATTDVLKDINRQIQLKYLLTAYANIPAKDSFFTKPNNSAETEYFFNKLAGSNVLKQQIIKSHSEADIKKSWQTDLQKFKLIRKKYLLYKDFE